MSSPKPPPPMNSSTTSTSATTTTTKKPSSSSSSSHFDISQLPSLRDGMSAEEESVRRRKTCRFIEEAGRVLKLPRVAVSTAMVFFHRFYAKHSFNEHDRFEVAVAAIVLAAKTEESPKKLNNVILECHKLKTRGMQAGRISASGGKPPPPESLDPKEEEFAKLKERILLLERVILHTIGFELSIDHPYKFFVDQIKKLIHARQLKYKTTTQSSSSASSPNNPQNPQNNNNNSVNDKQSITTMMNELVQHTMKFANDSMHTSLCLQFSPQFIATACVYLAAQKANVEPVGGVSDWPRLLGNPDIDSFASICIQIVELIVDRKDVDTIKKIRAQLELLKSRAENSNTSNSNSNSNMPRSPPPPPPPGSGGEPQAKRPKVG